MGDVLMGFIVDNDEAKSPRAIRVPPAKYRAIINLIETLYAQPAPDDAKRTAIRAAYGANIGPAWANETNNWIRASIIITDLSNDAAVWFMALFPRT